MQQNSPWTPERVEQLKKLVEAKLTASQIAAELGGGISRNAVIGRLKRMELKLNSPHGGQSVPRPQRARPAPRKVIAAASASFADAPMLRAAPIDPVVESDPAPVGGVIFDDLLRHHCRWPSGDPRSPNFRYCGAPRIEGKPYCAVHAETGVDQNRKV